MPPVRNPSEMFFGKPPIKKSSSTKFMGSRNFYILLMGIFLRVILVIILLMVKGGGIKEFVCGDGNIDDGEQCDLYAIM